MRRCAFYHTITAPQYNRSARKPDSNEREYELATTTTLMAKTFIFIITCSWKFSKFNLLIKWRKNVDVIKCGVWCWFFFLWIYTNKPNKTPQCKYNIKHAKKRVQSINCIFHLTLILYWKCKTAICLCNTTQTLKYTKTIMKSTRSEREKNSRGIQRIESPRHTRSVCALRVQICSEFQY